MNKLSDDEGWIRWTDSHPRPADDVLVEVITENGRRDTNKAGAFMWYGITDALRIVAYRFVKEENEMPTNHEIFETLPAHETWIEWQQCYIKPNDHQLVKVYLKDGKISSGLVNTFGWGDGPGTNQIVAYKFIPFDEMNLREKDAEMERRKLVDRNITPDHDPFKVHVTGTFEDTDRFIKQPRYQDENGEDWIDECARTMTPDEFRGAMVFTLGKYLRRLGKKDTHVNEVRKIADYANRWLEYETRIAGKSQG